MVRHNKVIPNGHFHKKWQHHVKTWFNQPMKKKRRALKRKEKNNRRLPMPIEHLRPMVHCPSVRYNSKIRPGRGFTLNELKAAGLNKNFAKSIGIAVDLRRQNKSLEAKNLNVQRLKEYHFRLIVFPLNKKRQRKEMKELTTYTTSGINKPICSETKVKARVIAEDEKKFSAYEFIRKARADVKYYGIRLKRNKLKNENIELPLKNVRLRSQEID